MTGYKAVLLGSVAGLFAMGVAQASPIQAAAPAKAQSYAELLQPVPDAGAALVADDLARDQAQKPLLQKVQLHHHHHHHHHHSFFPGFGFYFGPRAYDEDCYWRLGRPYWNGWRWVRRRIRVCE